MASAPANANLDQAAMASLKQIHSDCSICCTMSPAAWVKATRWSLSTPGVAVSVRTADCFPILLADPETRAVAAIHAGWRGTAAGVVRSSLDRMRSEFGTDPENVFAAIGPGIGAVLLRSRRRSRAAVRDGGRRESGFSCGKPKPVDRRGTPARQDRAGRRLHFLPPCAIFFLAPRSRSRRTDDFLHPRDHAR